MNKQILIQALHFLKYALGPALLVFVIWINWDKQAGGRQVGISRILAPDFEMNWWPLALALVICTACMILTFVRWYILVRAQDLPFTVASAVRLGLIGAFFNLFLPGAVTGDLVKMVQLARAQSRRTVAVATIIVDRVIGLCGLIWLMGLLGAVFWCTGIIQEMVPSPNGWEYLEPILLVSWVLVAGSLVFWFLLGFLPLSMSTHWIARIEKIPKLGHALAELCRATLMYRSRGRAVAIAMLMAIVGHTGFVLTFYFCSLSVNPAASIPSASTHFLIVPVGATIQAVPLTPGGMGVGEAAFGELYALVNKKGELYSFENKDLDPERAEGVFARLMSRMLECLLGMFGFMVYWRMKPALQAAADEQKSGMVPPADVPGQASGVLQTSHPS